MIHKWVIFGIEIDLIFKQGDRDDAQKINAVWNIAGVTSGVGAAWASLAEILEEQKFESKSEENYKRKTSTIKLDCPVNSYGGPLIIFKQKTE